MSGDEKKKIEEEKAIAWLYGQEMVRRKFIKEVLLKAQEEEKEEEGEIEKEELINREDSYVGP